MATGRHTRGGKLGSSGAILLIDQQNKAAPLSQSSSLASGAHVKNRQQIGALSGNGSDIEQVYFSCRQESRSISKSQCSFEDMQGYGSSVANEGSIGGAVKVVETAKINQHP